MDLYKLCKNKSGICIIVTISLIVVIEVISLIKMVYDEGGESNGSYRIRFEMGLDDENSKVPHIDCHKHLKK